MILYGNLVWEGLSTETKPSMAEGAENGHIFKELDTGESYARIAEEWQYINLGLSFIKATKSGKVITDGTGQCHVAFTTPFINVNYTVALSCADTGSMVAAFENNLTINGFDLVARDKNGHTVNGVTVSWLATRDYNP
jgi:hypothetical protein